MNQEFAEYIKNHIREYLPADYQDADISLKEVTKGNDRTLTGLIIRRDDETVTPTIYLEHYGEQFGKGRPMEDIMKEIAQIKMESSLELPIDVKGLEDYETARPLLAIRLCDPEKNQEYLKDKPCTACGELAAAYRIQVMEGSEGIASAIIRACSATLANNKAEIRDKAERERPSATWKGSRAAGQRQSHRQRFHVGVP